MRITANMQSEIRRQISIIESTLGCNIEFLPYILSLDMNIIVFQ